MAERLILDPDEVSTGRTELDITDWIGPDGVDFGDAGVEAFYSESQRGDIPVDYRIPNRQISGGLVLKSVGGTTATAARAAIQAKLALFQREGGWLKRVTNGGGTVYADVVNATFRATSVPGYESRGDFDTGASFTLEAIPDFYGDEVTDADNSTTSQRELLYTTALDSSDGDSPNRVRLVVDNDGSTDWRGLIWCFRSRHYPGATAATRNTGSASMVYEAESLGALDTATLVAGTAVYGTATNGQWSGGTVVHHGTLSTSWTPVLSGRIGGTTYPTHTGSYDLYARLASTGGTAVRARAVYDVGDLTNPTELSSVRIPGANNPYILKLGEVRVDDPGIGTHRWDWQIQGAGDAGAENLSVDKVWLVNKDEGMGVLSAPINLPQGLATYSARSEFTTESGAITGDSLAVGGTWTGAGDADDISVAGGTATRTATSDSGGGFQLGRLITASGPSLSGCVVGFDFKWSARAQTVFSFVVARYTDTNNFLYAGVGTAAFVPDYLVVGRRIGGSGTNLTPTQTPSLLQSIQLDTWYSFQLFVSTSGIYELSLSRKGADTPEITFSGTDPDLATGGSLASGKVGIGDYWTAATASTRTYDNFAAWVPPEDAVAFDGQSAQITTDGMLREDAGGTAYGPVSGVAGDLPRLPVPHQSGGTVESLLVPSLGDFDQLPDTMGTASISARNFRRPSWLFVDDT